MQNNKSEQCRICQGYHYVCRETGKAPCEKRHSHEWVRCECAENPDWEKDLARIVRSRSARKSEKAVKFVRALLASREKQSSKD